MAQTRDGAIRVAATKAGVSVSDYIRRSGTGQKWCTCCKKWHQKHLFGRDSSRWDGLDAKCFDSRQQLFKKNYRPKTILILKGRSFVPARDGDKKQARRRVNFFVEAGLLKHPSLLPCTDCGHTWKHGERRHEYDHYLGYAARYHEVVQAVCSKCHHLRSDANGKN